MSTAAPARASLRDGIKVGLGQLHASDEPDAVLCALGLGSCIGLIMVDPAARVAGMAHVMLPESAISAAPGPPGKYADTAVPALIDAVRRLGGDRSRLVVTMAGGAQMFSGGSGGGVLNVGARNGVAVRAALAREGLRLRAADTGGSAGRTLEVAVGTGAVTVRAVGGDPVTL